MMQFRTAILAGIAVALLPASGGYWATPAFAQTNPNGASPALETVVVTAQKRAQNVQQVPIAISALTSSELRDRDFSGSGDLERMVPGISMKAMDPINYGLSIRGVGTQNFHVTAQQAVGQYLDEVSLVTPFTSTLGMFDLQRVEVLKGPQNTLFGRNTTGGAVNYITHKPSVEDGFNGYIHTRIGNEGRFDADGAIGFPLSDTVAVRGAFQVKTRDGVFTNIANGHKLGAQRLYGGRLGISWDPDSHTSVLLSGHVGFNRSQPTPYKGVGLFASDGVSPCPLLDSGISQFDGPNTCLAKSKTGALTNVSTSGWNKVRASQVGISHVDFEGGMLHVRHDFGAVSLTSITGYDRTSLVYQQDLSGAPYEQFIVGQGGSYNIFSQEVRFTSEGTKRFKWIAGAFYSNENDHLNTIVQNNSIAHTPAALTPSVELHQTANIYSLYGQADVNLTDKLVLTGGLRWTDDERSGIRTPRSMMGTNTGTGAGTPFPVGTIVTMGLVKNTLASVMTPCAPHVVPCVGPAGHVWQHLSKFGGKIGLKYNFTDNIMGYVSYSRGFKSGAFDVRAQAILLGTAQEPVGPETLDAYEAGVKTTLLNDRLQLDGAVFFYNWRGLQAFVVASGIGPEFVNIPKTRLYGAEMETKAVLGDGWALNGGVTYVHSRIADDGGYSDVVTGAPVANAPNWTVVANLTKTIAVGNASTLILMANTRYASSQYSVFTADPAQRIEPAAFLDLSAAYEFGSSMNYKIKVWGQNVTATKTCIQQVSQGSLTNTNSCLPNPGIAFYGVDFDIDF